MKREDKRINVISNAYADINNKLNELDVRLFSTTFCTRAMGSGGVGQIKHLKNKKLIRVQISYGVGKYNYAKVIEVKYLTFKK